MTNTPIPTARFLLMVSIVASVVGLTSNADLRAASSGPLDGRTFIGESGPAGKQGDTKETIVFRDGRFRSLACDPYGFGDAFYTATAEADGSIRFEAETASKRQGTMHWEGVIRGDQLDGTLVWKPRNNIAKNYWVRASQKQQRSN
ncbi:MAG: hypothetical protein ABI718_04905 [Acidobacteriota bacterium]